MSTPVQVSDTESAHVSKRRSLLPQSFHEPVTKAHIVGIFLTAIPMLFLTLQVLAAGAMQSTSTMLLLIFLIYCFIYVFVIVHEFGHAFAAKMFRFQIHAIKLGPLHVIFPSLGSWRFTWSSHSPLGFVQASPMSSKNARLGMALFIVAGPIASILAGLLCLLIATWIHEPGNSKLAPSAPIFRRYALFAPRTFAEAAFNSAGLVFIGLTTMCLIPMKHGSFYSDGAHLWGLLRGGSAAKRQILLQMLGTRMTSGVRPRDWDDTIVRDLIASRTGKVDDAQANLYCFYNAIDKRLISEANRYLGLALAQRDGYPEASRAALFVEGAYFDARFNADVLSARYWLALSRDGTVEEHTRLRAETAVAFASGKISEALSLAKGALAAVPESKDLGGRQAEQFWIEDLIELCQKQIERNNAGCHTVST
jgi:hypothetical protein